MDGADRGEGMGPRLAHLAPWCISGKDPPSGGDHPTLGASLGQRGIGWIPAPSHPLGQVPVRSGQPARPQKREAQGMGVVWGGQS